MKEIVERKTKIVMWCMDMQTLNKLSMSIDHMDIYCNIQL